MSAVTTLEERPVEDGKFSLITPALSLHWLPEDVIERILVFSSPRDVSRYAQTCHFARKLVYEPKDQLLWRELYLRRPFDDLRRANPLPRRHPDLPVTSASEMILYGKNEDNANSSQLSPWRTELQRRIEAETIVASDKITPEQLHRAFETFLAAVHTALPLSESDVGADGKTVLLRSENLHWVDRVLRRTGVLDRTELFDETAPDSEGLRQLKCRLRAYVALSHESSFSVTSRERMAHIRKMSRCFVYDMRKYQPETLWGPYRVVSLTSPPFHGSTESALQSRADASGEAATGLGNGVNVRHAVVVNWEHVEHILNVVGLKLREVSDACFGFYKKPIFHMEDLRAYSAVGSFERDPHDWAGITGKWRRHVCFMDYRDLYMTAPSYPIAHPPVFNYAYLTPGPHHPSFFEDPFDEALRPVEMELTIIPPSEYLHDASRILRTAEDDDGSSGIDDPAFPPLYFEGRSRGPHGSVATISGKVSTLADGAVRWQFVTTYDGQMRWSAEGVQIGHVCSAAGIAGIWTMAQHQHDDPAGPFWMVKVNDVLPDGVLNVLH
ncbi:hypothetical protein BD414DRAFT_578981 [Trametes punicea]|nr:hypothetical protein BD414DRAFT_578981 [Trametes punicea]